jgi:hypothetical protein
MNTWASDSVFKFITTWFLLCIFYKLNIYIRFIS